MAVVVVDASVVVKSLFPERGETDSALAIQLWRTIRAGRAELIQPSHWLAEVAAVIARLSAATAAKDVRDLYALEIETAASASIYETACELSISLGHHLFDTLYHAVALEVGGTLITADERYYRKAQGQGRVSKLSDYVTA